MSLVGQTSFFTTADEISRNFMTFEWDVETHLNSSPLGPNNDNAVALCAIHYDDVIMTMLASQITSLAVVYSIVYSGVDQRKHQSSASLAFVREIHRGPVNFPQKWPVTRKIFPFDDVIMLGNFQNSSKFSQISVSMSMVARAIDAYLRHHESSTLLAFMVM